MQESQKLLELNADQTGLKGAVTMADLVKSVTFVQSRVDMCFFSNTRVGIKGIKNHS